MIGEAGLGKSTLIAELKKSHAAFTWLRGEALSYTRSVSYYPWRQIIRQAITASEDDSPIEVRDKLHLVCERCAIPAGDVPFLEAMLAVERQESSQAGAEIQGEALVQKMVEATRAFLSGLASEGPLILAFDDLHWADEASLNLLLNLIDLTITQPIAFLCMLRPDKAAASWETIQQIQRNVGSRYQTILLQPLGAEQTDLLLMNLLGMKDLPKSIRDLIVERADGNPFFIEELIRSLIETNQIIREENHWRANGEEANVSLPNTFRGVLGARIDRLPELTKHILQNAAVVGRSFELRVLHRLTHLDEELDPHIQYLEDVSLVEALLNEYAFRHVLIQETAYDSILIKTRTELHRQIGEALEELYANRIDEFAPLLANHFYAARDGRSLQYDQMAGENAARLYANAEAATHFRRALEVAKRSPDNTEQITKLYAQLGPVLELGGHYEQALQNYDEMQAFGHDHHEPATEMAALMAKATMYSTFTQIHNSDLSEQLLLQALDISREIGDRTAQAKLSWNLMLTYLFSKRLDQALEHGVLALSLARESGDREQLAFVLNDLCRLYTCRGEFAKAHAVIEEARQLWRALDNQVMLADSFGSEAEAYFNAGEFEPSLLCSQAALQITEKIENLWGQAYDRMLISFVHFEVGKVGEGIRLAEQSIQLADEAGLIASSIGLRSELAWFYAYSGAYEKGYELIEQALRTAEAKQPAWKSFPQAARIRMQLLQADLPAALQFAGNTLIEPISIPYARYTIFLCMANIELAVSRGDYELGIRLADDLLSEVIPLTRVDIPDVLCWKGKALVGLGQFDQAHQVLMRACSLAENLGAKPQLWPCLASLAAVNSQLGNHQEAEANREKARVIIHDIAESLQSVGLSDLFLTQARVQALMS